MTAASSDDQPNDSGLVNLYARDTKTFLAPPRGAGSTLRFLGPGLILVGSIVGSGELIMTTKLGAQAGFALLWFVLISCLIKSPVQAELGRHVISSGETILVMFNRLPGPRSLRPSWLSLPWLLLVALTSLIGLAAASWLVTGPLVGLGLTCGVLSCWVIGAALFSARHRRIVRTRGNDPQRRPVLGWFLWVYLGCQLVMFINGGAVIGGAGQALALGFKNVLPLDSWIWTVGIALFCGSLLLTGRYKMLERVSLGLVALFTLITLLCTALLNFTDNAVTIDDIRAGLDFTILAEPGRGVSRGDILLTALAMYAATGIGTWEMMQYTYWCVEKGYARHTGENEPGDQWPQRARGWIRVMYTDVLLTMVVFTVSTICFYFLGAAILYPESDPVGIETLSMLQQIFTGSLGRWAATLFVVGGFVVLFSTTFSATAGTSRLVADAMCVIGIIDARDYPARLRFMRGWVVFGLTMGTLTYYLLEDPPLMLVISGMVSVIMYPVFGLGTIYLRYRGVDERIRPGIAATGLLWICGLSLVLISPIVAIVGLGHKLGWFSF